MWDQVQRDVRLVRADGFRLIVRRPASLPVNHSAMVAYCFCGAAHAVRHVVKFVVEELA